MGTPLASKHLHGTPEDFVVFSLSRPVNTLCKFFFLHIVSLVTQIFKVGGGWCFPLDEPSLVLASLVELIKPVLGGMEMMKVKIFLQFACLAKS